ncbi:S8 family serine peptidase [Cohnella sp.]|uniref:S8 family peptidase n=1 Tax=Cohnella sp. TaxID=1883426 RepID=UPI00356B1272
MRNRYPSLALSAVILFLFLPIQASLTSASDRQEGLEQEIVIVYKNDKGKEAAHGRSVKVRHEFAAVPALSATVAKSELEELAANPNIAYIERNVTFRVAERDYRSVSAAEAAERSLWSFQAVQPTLLWEEGFTGAGVKVAVIDSGISAHGELTIAGGFSAVDYTDSYADDNGHGTHVAGIIAARSDGKGIVGIAPDVRLYAVKSLDQDGKGNLLDLLEGLDWAIANHMDVINLSFGTKVNSPLLKSLVDRAYREGILVVAAVGNDQMDVPLDTNTINYPAKYDSVMAVAAIDKHHARGPSSSVGEQVEFAAPGYEILSTYVDLDGSEVYAETGGTSQAAPHVSGMMALLKQKYPAMSNVALREELRKFTVDLGVPGRDREYGFGEVSFRDDGYSSAAPVPVSGVSPTSEADKLNEADLALGRAEDSLAVLDFVDAMLAIQALDDARKREERITALNSLRREMGFHSYPARTIRPFVPVGISLEAAMKNQNYKYVDEASVKPGLNVFVLNGKGELAQDAEVRIWFNRIVVMPASGAFASNETYTVIVDSSVRGRPGLVQRNAAELRNPLLLEFAVTSGRPALSDTAASNGSPFTDVKQGSWYEAAAQWGFDRGIIKGYPDGTFKPGKTVTEAEFLAMLLRAFEPDPASSKGKHWAEELYRRAETLNYPLNGARDLRARDAAILRGQVAELISATEGVNFKGDDAIHYLLAFGLAEGTNPNDISLRGFLGDKALTRAEALQFIRTLVGNGIGGLLEKPYRANDPNDLPPLPSRIGN